MLPQPPSSPGMQWEDARGKGGLPTGILSWERTERLRGPRGGCCSLGGRVALSFDEQHGRHKWGMPAWATASSGQRLVKQGWAPLQLSGSLRVRKGKKKTANILCIFKYTQSFFLQYLINPQHCLNLENSEMTPDLALPRASPPPRVQRVYTCSCSPVSRVPQWLPR